MVFLKVFSIPRVLFMAFMAAAMGGEAPPPSLRLTKASYGRAEVKSSPSYLKKDYFVKSLELSCRKFVVAPIPPPLGFSLLTVRFRMCGKMLLSVSSLSGVRSLKVIFKTSD